jgi:DNA-binding NtrC family response regulator
MGSLSAGNKAAVRTVVLASADTLFRERLRQQLTAMRWQVREAGGGAEAMAQLETQGAEAMVLDNVLPDLEVGEFARQMRSRHPVMDLLWVEGGVEEAGARSPRRNELLQALRQARQDAREQGAAVEMAPRAGASAGVAQDSAADRLGPGGERARAALQVAALLLRSRGPASTVGPSLHGGRREGQAEAVGDESATSESEGPGSAGRTASARASAFPADVFESERPTKRPRALPLPEMVGESFAMLELARLVRLVAPRSTTVLIEGDTGTGKELVAKAVHRLGARAAKPFLVLNCAAIPEALLEAELFGHTRGAFTGAVQSRTGRIEAAHGGTLFLDEIGEMPLALQAKMLRFLESGELQRVGDNETVRVDVRVVAATHQHLQQCAAERTFRLDLYHRLAVFPVFVPALRNRMEDVLPLAAYLLSRLGEETPVKRLSAGGAMRLMEHDWPGNVRELAHVLERGAILAEDRREIARDEIRF